MLNVDDLQSGAQQQCVTMSDPPPGESLGARYGDPRLDLRARHLAGGGAVTEVFRVKEEGDTISIRCQVCEMTVYGLRNLNQHIANKKHQAKFSSKVHNCRLLSRIPYSYLYI